LIDTVGHSRLPVFRDPDETEAGGGGGGGTGRPADVYAFLLTKQLMRVNPAADTPLSALTLHEPIVIGCVCVCVCLVTVCLYAIVSVSVLTRLSACASSRSTGQLLMDAMAQFQEGHTHLALVSAHPAALRRTIRAGLPPEPGSDTLGILTVEDILEVMLQADITDKTDAQNSAARQEASASLRMMSSSASLSASRSSAVPAHIGFLSSIFDRPARYRC
jgi:hypothetical protein